MANLQVIKTRGFGDKASHEAIEHTKSNTLPLVDTQGKYRLRSLFYECLLGIDLDNSIYRPVWTVREQDLELSKSSVWYRPDRDNVLPSIRKIYLSFRDPSEHQFALSVFGSWDHWQALTKLSFLKDHLPKWREELQLLLEAEAFQHARRVASTGEGAVALAAAKWVHNAVQPKKGKGRPSKDDVQREAKRLAEEAKDTRDDQARIGASFNVSDLSEFEQELLKGEA